MSAGGAPKNTTNETEKETAPSMKDKMYTGAVFESLDDDNVIRSRYHHWKQKYIGDQIRAPQHLPPAKKPPKVPEVPSSSTLSTALGYIISPVKYLASAFTYSGSDTDKSSEKSKARNSSKAKEQPLRPLEVSKQTGAVTSTVVAPQLMLDTSQKSLEAPVKALKTMPLSEITAANSMAAAKSRGGTPTLSNSKDKKSASKHKLRNGKKIHEIKKSLSQQIKGSPKIFKSYTPPRNADTFPVVSNTKLFSVNDMKIVQSNRAAFRVVSREDANANPDGDVLTVRSEGNAALASKSNNSNVVCQLSPMLSPLRDELSFVDDPLLVYPVHRCSNSSPYTWNLAESSRHKHPFHPDFSHVTRRPHGPLPLVLPMVSNVQEVLNISCDRQAIETIFSGSLLTQSTPPQLLAGHKSQPRTSLLQESFNIDSADFRETLQADDNTPRFTSPHNWQPVKDYTRDSSYIIVATGPTPKKTPAPQSPKNPPKAKPKAQKISKAKTPAWAKRKTSKQESARMSPSTSRTHKSQFLLNVSKPPVKRPSSSPSPTWKRTDSIIHSASQKKEEIHNEETKKPPAAAAGLNTLVTVAAATAMSEAVAKAATSKVLSTEAQTLTKPQPEEPPVNEISPTATMPATERSSALSRNEETWLVHAIRSLSPKRPDPPHNITPEAQSPPSVTPARQPASPIEPSPPMTPGTASNSPKSLTITSAGATMTQAEPVGTPGSASMTAAVAVREALKLTTAVREAMKMSQSVNILGKKRMSSLTTRAEYDQERQDDYPKYFSVSATLYGEFP